MPLFDKLGGLLKAAGDEFPQGITTGCGMPHRTRQDDREPVLTLEGGTRGPSALEARFLGHLRALGLPEPEREYRFAPPRRWRFDFAWPHCKLAVELEGGVWTHGRHSRGEQVAKDCEKYNTATLMGWKVLRFTTNQVREGEAIRVVEQALVQAQSGEE